MITKVTITGADDSILPADLFELSSKYPFVEWGILVSKSQIGKPRFPSAEWMSKLCELMKENETGTTVFHVSIHLCGSWLRGLLLGKRTFTVEEIAGLWLLAERVQLNFHGELHEVNIPEFFRLISYSPKEFIFQYENVNGHKLLAEAPNYPLAWVSTLFDLSHGAGVLPSEWPKPIKGVSCGYAGGLSPANLHEQIRKIESVVGDTPIWIDMETHVRSNNDFQFDLEKVNACLKIASEFVWTDLAPKAGGN